MKLITIDQVSNIYEYEKIRNAFRQKVMEEKRLRRIGVGPVMTFAFENRDTVLFQIQEMMRIERLVADAAVQGEIDTYNQLVPSDDELSATLLIEITEQEKIKPTLDSLVGLGFDSVFLNIAGHEIPANFDEAQSSEDRISAVQYLKWRLSSADLKNLESPNSPVAVVVRHPNYKYETALNGEQKAALRADIAQSAAAQFV